MRVDLTGLSIICLPNDYVARLATQPAEITWQVALKLGAPKIYGSLIQRVVLILRKGQASQHTNKDVQLCSIL